MAPRNGPNPMEQNFNAYQIIAKKRDGLKLTSDEIRFMIKGLLTGQVADYQMSALLMAIYIKGFDQKETTALTDAMLYSGKTLQFDDVRVVDKHSTGGVGDKTSFILAPLARACGVKVPMIAGRGLGHTGGTVDKIEAVTNFKTSLSLQEFQKMVIEDGLVLMGQTPEIAPADKRIYALRDVTATIESIPLITASIMSKKLAEGARGIVMDIKVGQGAFMKETKRAKELALSLSATAKRFNRSMMTVLSDMNQPLGYAIGNSLEIIECVETLKGNGPKDLTDLSLHLAGGMVYLAGLSKTHQKGIQMATEALHSGAGLAEFRKMIGRQGGDVSQIDHLEKLPRTEIQTEVLATKKGYIKSIDCLNFGMHSVSLGGGRRTAEDAVDFAVGLIMHKKVGDFVNKGEALVTIHHHKSQKAIVKDMMENIQKKDIVLSTQKVQRPKLIIDTIVTKAKK
ncbi:MAG: pyrimidine-nucleoside phosphorylase [Bacteriovoracaceae bacterium]